MDKPNAHDGWVGSWPLVALDGHHCMYQPMRARTKTWQKSLDSSWPLYLKHFLTCKLARSKVICNRWNAEPSYYQSSLSLKYNFNLKPEGGVFRQSWSDKVRQACFALIVKSFLKYIALFYVKQHLEKCSKYYAVIRKFCCTVMKLFKNSRSFYCHYK